MDSYLEQLVIIFCLVAAMFLFLLTFHSETTQERARHRAKGLNGRKL